MGCCFPLGRAVVPLDSIYSVGWTEPWHNIQEAGGQVGIWDHRPSFPAAKLGKKDGGNWDEICMDFYQF